MQVNISFVLNEKLYLRDPQSSTLGKKILCQGLELIAENGFEDFNFKKLAERIDSTEASIYRYFKNKHLLLLYYYAWHWQWVNYLITASITAKDKPVKQLEKAIEVIVNPITNNTATSFIDESKLQQIVINEGSKVYHTRLVDQEEKEGLYLDYKALVDKLVEIIKAVKPRYSYPKMLASNIIEMAHNQVYFAEHLPNLTDIQTSDIHKMKDVISSMAAKLLA